MIKVIIAGLALCGGLVAAYADIRMELADHHARLDSVPAMEQRLTTRLDRIEEKLDRISERHALH